MSTALRRVTLVALSGFALMLMMSAAQSVTQGTAGAGGFGGFGGRTLGQGRGTTGGAQATQSPNAGG